MQRAATWMPWLYWILLLTGLTSYLAYALYEEEADVFLIGAVTHGHHQIELSCSSCHSDAFGGGAVLQNACVDCHGADLKQANDAHPKTKFTDPRNADRVELLDARVCITCHVEHHPERVRPMGVTQPDDFCITCHKDIADDRPSHRGLDFASCATGGCHNFHDNRALYEDFLLAHQSEPEQLPVAQVAPSELGKLMAVVLEHPLEPVLAAAADAPETVHVEPQHVQDWEQTAHAQAGVNCMGCHSEAIEGTGRDVWRERPDMAVCARCHAPETDGFKAGLHGMRLQVGLSPMQPALAQLPMHGTAASKKLNCQSCHSAHRFDVRRAAVESCMGCHDDAHTNNYPDSPHARLWKAELDGRAPAGSGVSCATCHLPRTTHTLEGLSVVLTEHNQNLNLRPNEKMLRSVCMDCHGLAFAIDALADAGLVQSNFTGRPAQHVPSIDWAVRRHAEQEDSSSTPSHSSEGDPQ